MAKKKWATNKQRIKVEDKLKKNHKKQKKKLKN